MAGWELLGRESELRQVESFLDSASAGPATLVIEGAAGIGKTSLWGGVLQLAVEHGLQVHSCRPADAEAKLSFSALADLLELVPEAAFAALPDPQRHAVEVALLRADPRGGAPDARAAATAVRTLLTLLAEDSPVLVAIDDAQWLDLSSARAVDFALRRVRDVPVSLLVARRTGVREGSTNLESALAGAETLEVGPLTLAATHELLKRRLGRSLPRRLLLRVHEAAGGNPFYALEVGRVVVEQETGASDPLPVPDNLSELALRRVRKLHAPAREALLVVAAAGRPSVRLLEEVLDDGRSAVDEAKDAGLLEEGKGVLAPTHPLYAAAVYSAAPRQRRRQVHGRLAAVVAEPEERARHLALAAAAPGEEVASVLRAAAEAAKVRGALHAAVELVDLAVGLTPGNVDELRLDLADLLRITGDAERAREILEDLVENASGSVKPRALITLAAVRYWAHGAIAAVACLERAIEAATDEPMVEARAQVDTASYCDFDLEKSFRHAQRALQLCREASERADPFVEAQALEMAARASLMLGRGLPLADIEHGLEIERRAMEREPSIHVGGRGTTTLGQWLKYIDDFEGARARLENARREAVADGDESALPNILQHLAQTELWSGNWEVAQDYADTACEIAVRLGLGYGGPQIHRAAVDAHRGQTTRACEVALEGLEGVEGNPLAAPFYLRVLGFVELSRGNAAEASAHLRSALSLMAEVRILEPGVLRIHADAVEALVGAGDLDQAEAVLTPWEEQARRIDLAWSLATSARCRGLLEAARGRTDLAFEAFDRAIAEHERLPMPFELGRTLLARGQVERRAKRKAAAKTSLAAALAIFEELGAPLWIEKAHGEIARLGLRHAPGELTESERRVAELVATGLTNRQVAAQLFMSPKTVEANLARAYRKLGIHSRAELGARLAGMGKAPAKT